MLIDGGKEIRAVAGGASILRLQNDVAEAGNDARKRIETELIVALRASVGKHEEWILVALDISGGKCGDAFERNSIFAPPLHGAYRPELDGRSEEHTSELQSLR